MTYIFSRLLFEQEVKLFTKPSHGRGQCYSIFPQAMLNSTSVCVLSVVQILCFDYHCKRNDEFRTVVDT